MTVRDSMLRTTVHPNCGAKLYSFSICQSVSFRASHVETTCRSISGASWTPVCGIETITGASPRVTWTQLSILAFPHAPMQRIEAHAVHQLSRVFDVPDGEIAL